MEKITNEKNDAKAEEMSNLQLDLAARELNDKEQLENDLDQLHDLNKMKYYELEREKDKLMNTFASCAITSTAEPNVKPNLPRPCLKNPTQTIQCPQSSSCKYLRKSTNHSLTMFVKITKWLRRFKCSPRSDDPCSRRSPSSRAAVALFTTKTTIITTWRSELRTCVVRALAKALIYQKKFLLITIASSVGIGNMNLPLFKTDPKKRKTLR